MSNIRGIGDLEGGGYNPMQRSQANPNVYAPNPQGQRAIKDPRSENFWDFLKYACCPKISITQLIVWIVVIQLILWIVSLCIQAPIGPTFLEPNMQALIVMGAKCTHLMQKGHVYRFITANFLHGSFIHILGNSIAQLIFGIGLEIEMGKLRFITLYILTGVGGILFSSMISNDAAVGASTAVYGLMAMLIIFTLINFDVPPGRALQRCQTLCLLLMILMLNLMITLTNPNKIDLWGHLGGLIAGIFLGFALVERVDNVRISAWWKIIGWSLYGIFCVVCFSLFFTIINTSAAAC